jgi:hypothetical protein
LEIETEAGTAEEQPARNNLTSGKEMEGAVQTAPSYPNTFPLPHASENLNKKNTKQQPKLQNRF